MLARNTILLAALDLAESLGLSRSRVYHEIHLNENLAEASNAYVPAAAVIDAVEFAAWRTQRSDFGFMLADRRNHLNLGLLGLLIEQCASVAEVYDVGKRFLHHHNGALEFDLRKERTRAVVRMNIHAQPEYQPRHYVEAVLAMHVRTLGIFLGPLWRPAAVYLRHEQLGGRAGYDRRFGRGVRFRQRFNGLIFRPTEVDRRVAVRDPLIKLKLEDLMQELSSSEAAQDCPAKVARFARMLLPSGGVNIERIASLLATSSRSLQRELMERGTSFSEILAETRTAMAREYLSRSGLTASQLAPLLGFSEPSAVSRFLAKKANTSVRALKDGGAAPRPPSATR
jgi:AraC-like DNA-binding protein